MNPRHIDYRDLQISVSDNLSPFLAVWIEEFNSSFENIIIEPRLRAGLLLINSFDLINFLGYADPSLVSEIDWKRFKKECERQMGMLLQKSIHPDRRYHYQWSLTALNQFLEGRYRAAASGESAS
jgi:hypothetical protein